MATSTEVAIATTTLGSAASSITFSSIPSTYTDLRVVVVGKQSGAGNYAGLRFNGDTATNYSITTLWGTGAGAYSARDINDTNMFYQWNGVTTSTIPVFHTVDIFSYAGSTYKTSLFTVSQDTNGGTSVDRVVGLWRSTSAINSLTFMFNGSDTWSAGTTATLYGIL